MYLNLNYEKNLSLVLSVAFVALLIFSASYFSKNSSVITKNEGTAYIGARVSKVSFYDLSGKKVDFSDFKGKKVMVWFFATWCPSCIAGMQELERNNAKLQNLKIIALKTYANAGYPGPDIKSFVKQYGKSLLGSSNWSFGSAFKEDSLFFNPKNYPDIYFLVDDGIIKDIAGAPSATIAKIISFANSK